MQGRTDSCSRCQGIMDDTQRFEIDRRVLSTNWLSHLDPTKDSAIKAGQCPVHRDGQHIPRLERFAGTKGSVLSLASLRNSGLFSSH
jgi:hypothetical protein